MSKLYTEMNCTLQKRNSHISQEIRTNRIQLWLDQGAHIFSYKYKVNQCITHLSVHLGIFTLEDYLKEMVNGNVRLFVITYHLYSNFCNNLSTLFYMNSCNYLMLKTKLTRITKNNSKKS